jgi:1,4-alpha-glucan branching enzyme
MENSSPFSTQTRLMDIEIFNPRRKVHLAYRKLMNEIRKEQNFVIMKHHHNHHNVTTVPDAVPVRFELIHPTAKSVCVAGTFNNWQPEAKSLHPSDGGKWWKETTMKPGTYEYCFIVDGQWVPDPQAKETIPNPFGGRNSVLKVVSPSAK